MNKGLTPVGGTKLVSASFAEINTAGVQLANLKPQGYEQNSYFTDPDVGGTWGDFVITFLDEGGEAIGMYGWEQAYDGENWEEGAWSEYINEAGEGAFDVVPVGMSMFFTSPIPEDGEKYELPTAGEVVLTKLDYELPEGTCQWGNPRATKVSIDELVPTGYLNNAYFTDPDVGGTWGDFVITFLDEGGEAIGMYGWEQAYDGENWEEGAWSEYIAAESTDLEAGDGIFVTGAYHDGDEGTPYCLSLPEMVLSK